MVWLFKTKIGAALYNSGVKFIKKTIKRNIIISLIYNLKPTAFF